MSPIFGMAFGFGKAGLRTVRVGFFVGISVLALGQAAHAAETVGAAVKIRNTVQASLENRNLAVQDPVYASEVVSAAAQSHGEIILNDDSKVIVGENSEIRLDDFVISDGSFKKATINVAKGAFRFISGNSAKGTFNIKTPLSNIGIRGTVFDVYVGEGGVTSVVLLSGAVRVCTLGNRCLIAERSCDIIEVRSRSDITAQPFLRSNARTPAQEQQAFNLLSGQNRFDRRFRANTVACSARAAFESNERRQSINPNQGGNTEAVPEVPTPDPAPAAPAPVPEAAPPAPVVDPTPPAPAPEPTPAPASSVQNPSPPAVTRSYETQITEMPTTEEKPPENLPPK
jgi:hypothetical protein